MNAGATTANVVATPHASEVAHKAANTAVLKSQEFGREAFISRAQLWRFQLGGSFDERHNQTLDPTSIVPRRTWR